MRAALDHLLASEAAHIDSPETALEELGALHGLVGILEMQIEETLIELERDRDGRLNSTAE